MQWVEGTKHNPTNDNRQTNSITASYTLFLDGSTYRCEASYPNGTDQSDADEATVLQGAFDALS